MRPPSAAVDAGCCRLNMRFWNVQFDGAVCKVATRLLSVIVNKGVAFGSSGIWLLAAPSSDLYVFCGSLSLLGSDRPVESYFNERPTDSAS